MEHIDMAMSSGGNDVVAARMPDRHWLVEFLHWQAKEVSLLLPICVKVSLSGEENSGAHAQVWPVSTVQSLKGDGWGSIPHTDVLAHSSRATVSCMCITPNYSTHLRYCT